MWCGAGWIALLGVLAWLFQSWPGGFWGWLGIAWGWLRETPNGYESASTTIRNLGLLVAAPFALWFAYWRARVADRQSKAAQEQVATLQRQAETAQRGLLNERYQKGAEMLGSGVLSVRLGGIYALARLAREHPEEYHMQIIRLFCAFVRNPISEDVRSEEDTNEVETKTELSDRKKATKKPELRPDVQEIMTAIGGRSDTQICVEKEENPTFRLDLRKANLTNAELHRANLSNADFSYANLSGARLVMANLSGAWMPIVNLSGAELIGADLCNTQFMRTNLRAAGLNGAKLFGTGFSRTDISGAVLTSAHGLTQEQLDTACADQDNPPKLDSPFDALESDYDESEPPDQMIERLENERYNPIDEPLVWRGKSLNK